MKKENQQQYKIINGNSLEVLDTFEENSIDAIITDPPYELGFMGKSWDASGIAYNVELWKKALRVLKPGGYLLAFGGSRTFHRIACAIEDGGFEIRDTIMWLYGSGFPKSLNIGLAIDKKRGVESEVVGTGKSGSADTHTRCMNSVAKSGEDVFGGEYKIKKANNEWSGWGSCLKPAFEPIIMARKPFKGSLVDNVLEYGVGGLNIDECRVGNEIISGGTMPDFRDIGKKSKEAIGIDKLSFHQVSNVERKPLEEHVGRFPANIIHDGSEEVISGMPETKSSGSQPNYESGNQDNPSHLYTNIKSGQHFEDEGSASRYFYCAKASSKDRDEGLNNFETRTKVFNGQSEKSSKDIKEVEARFTTECKNIHPTVKPMELMQYLVRLVCPKGATILDIFNGSGSTGKAVAFENRERDMNYKYIGIELDPEYCKISEARIDYAANKYQYEIEEVKQNLKKIGQLSLFD